MKTFETRRPTSSVQICLNVSQTLPEFHRCAPVDTKPTMNYTADKQIGVSLQLNYLSSTSHARSQRTFIGVKEPEFLLLLGGDWFQIVEEQRCVHAPSPAAHTPARFLAICGNVPAGEKKPPTKNPNRCVCSDALLLGADLCCWLKRQEDVH